MRALINKTTVSLDYKYLHMNSKLQQEVSKLVEEQVISLEVAQDIKSYYNSKEDTSSNRLFIIFGVLGSVLVGMGIILILAHNWDDFSRGTKTIWAFIPLVVGQLAVGYALFKKKGVTWREASATFLFFAFGASIALVGQIYNIPGSMPSFLLSWTVLAAPLIYLLKSQAAALLYMVFSMAYACSLGYFNVHSPWWYLIMLLWIVPHYYKQLKERPLENLTGIWNWVVPLSLLISLGAFVSGDDSIGFLMYVALFGLFYNIGKLSFFTGKKLRVNGYLLLGSIGTITTLLIVSFKWFWADSSESLVSSQDLIITGVLLAAGLAVLIYLFQKKQLRPFNLFQYAFLIFTSIYFIRFISPEIPMILTNLLVFGLGVFAVHIGSSRGMFSILNYGLLIITMLIGCRFFDTEISYVIRGLLFLVIGAGFFGANYLMHKKQQKQNTSENE